MLHSIDKFYSIVQELGYTVTWLGYEMDD